MASAAAAANVVRLFVEIEAAMEAENHGKVLELANQGKRSSFILSFFLFSFFKPISELFDQNASGNSLETLEIRWKSSLIFEFFFFLFFSFPFSFSSFFFSVLKEIPDDKDALQLKAVSLVKLGKFADALKVIPAERAFERAYCLYRTNKLAEAQAAAKAANSADPKFSYLLAQVVRVCPVVESFLMVFVL